MPLRTSIKRSVCERTTINKNADVDPEAIRSDVNMRPGCGDAQFVVVGFQVFQQPGLQSIAETNRRIGGTGRKFLANSFDLQPAFLQQVCSQAFFFAQKAQQQVLGANVLLLEPVRLLGGVGEHALGLMAQRKIDGC